MGVYGHSESSRDIGDAWILVDLQLPMAIEYEKLDRCKVLPV